MVAALTIPTLLQKTNDAELKTAWKRDFAILSSAFLQLTNDKGGTIKGLYTEDIPGVGAGQLANDMSNYLGVIKKCTGYNPLGNCIPSEGKLLNGTSWVGSTNVNHNSGLILSNGALVHINVITANCDNGTLGDLNNWGGRCGVFDIDVNGFKKPNTVGKDNFSASFMSDGRIVPYGSQQDGGCAGCVSISTTCVQGSTDSANTGHGCAAKYLYE